MKATVIVTLFVVFYIGVNAQSLWKDFQYNAPASYKTIENSGRLILEKFVGKQYGQLVIFPLENTSADAAASFKAQWDLFARSAEQGVGDPETQEVETHDGWSYTFAAARGTFKGQMFAITLSSRYKEGYTYFVATVISDKQFLEDAIAFTNSVTLTKKAAASLKPVENNGSNSAPPAITRGVVSTQFSDGWTSAYIGPYVKVSKDDLQVWLFPTNDSLDKAGFTRDKELVEDRYWHYAVDQYFEVSNFADRPWNMRGSDRIYEADVRNRQTGEKSFVAMRVVWNNGSAKIVLAFTTTKERMYNSMFVQYHPFEEMLVYNKFIPTPKMLLGTWRKSETGATGYYSIAGGFQGGNAKVAFKDEFVFNADNTYQSKHGMKQRNEGTGEGYVQSYKGTYSVNGETVQLTGWRKDDPGTFACWMEAAEGGLALVMVNKKFTGQRYTVFKVN